jgi:hypothetical protein
MNGDEIFLNPYSYCDYWCEKCILQDQCLLYKHQNEKDEELPISEIYLENTIGLIHQYITGTAAELSDDRYDENNDDQHENHEYEDAFFNQISELVENHPLRLKSYFFFDKSRDFFEHYRENYLTPYILQDAFANLKWYRSILVVKMERTLKSFYEFMVKEDLFLLKDALLSSFVVYKSIRRLLSALKELIDNLTEYQEFLTEMEDLLVNIKKSLEHELPFWIIMRIVRAYLYSS